MSGLDTTIAPTSQSHMSLSISPTNSTNLNTYNYRPKSDRIAPSSPKAPAYSPITPKVQPALPANYQPAFVPPDENGGNFTFSPSNKRPPQLPQPAPSRQHARTKSTQQMSVPPAPTGQYIPQPPNLPFSSEEATDAIALRAAISTLQFQKKKAQDDIKTLASIKQLALHDPSHFKEELAAGRLSEQRPKIGDLKTVLDDEEGSEDSEEDAVLGASPEVERHDTSTRSPKSPEIPNSQPSQPSQPGLSAQDVSSKFGGKSAAEGNNTQQFPRIPGPQDVVRMPPVNWDKYGIVGEPLDSMHAQQQKWPGSAPFGAKGREHTIAAPYSPFHDQLEDLQRSSPDAGRKDSGPAPSATGTISEHIMETRSRH